MTARNSASPGGDSDSDLPTVSTTLSPLINHYILMKISSSGEKASHALPSRKLKNASHPVPSTSLRKNAARPLPSANLKNARHPLPSMELSPATQFMRTKVVLFINPLFIFVEVFTNFGPICVGSKNAKGQANAATGASTWDTPLPAPTNPDNAAARGAWGGGDGGWSTGNQADDTPEVEEQAGGDVVGDPGC